MDRTDFASADSKYRAVVAADLACGVSVSGNLSNYTEHFVLSALFDIAPEETAALYWAYERYEDMIGRVDEYFEAYRERERSEYADFFHDDRVWPFDYGCGFMKAACGLA